MAKELTEFQIMDLKVKVEYAERQMADIQNTISDETARDYTWKDSDFERRMIDLLLMHRAYREQAKALKDVLKEIKEEL